MKPDFGCGVSNVCMYACVAAYVYVPDMCLNVYVCPVYVWYICMGKGRGQGGVTLHHTKHYVEAWNTTLHKFHRNN